MFRNIKGVAIKFHTCKEIYHLWHFKFSEFHLLFYSLYIEIKNKALGINILWFFWVDPKGEKSEWVFLTILNLLIPSYLITKNVFTSFDQNFLWNFFSAVGYNWCFCIYMDRLYNWILSSSIEWSMHYVFDFNHQPSIKSGQTEHFFLWWFSLI